MHRQNRFAITRRTVAGTLIGAALLLALTAAYGDSGGPNFLGDSDVVAATTITGDAVCRSTNVTYRLDTPAARAFLSRFIAVP